MVHFSTLSLPSPRPPFLTPHASLPPLSSPPPSSKLTHVVFSTLAEMAIPAWNDLLSNGMVADTELILLLCRYGCNQRVNDTSETSVLWQLDTTIFNPSFEWYCIDFIHHHLSAVVTGNVLNRLSAIASVLSTSPLTYIWNPYVSNGGVLM